MTHASEAAILSLRDGLEADITPDVQRHVATCGGCSDALERARARAGDVQRALRTLDVGFDVGSARDEVRARVARNAAAVAGATPLPSKRAAWSRAHLARAAGLLLVVAGGASALPGSPVRAWLTEATSDGPAGAEPAAAATDVAGGDAAQAAEPAAIRVPGASGPFTVSLRGLVPGHLVEVRLVPGSRVSVLAPSGSAFGSAAGRIDATVTAGTVLVELPVGLAPVSIEAQGRVVLRQTAAGLEVSGPVEERAGDVIRFRFPGDG